MCDKVGTIKVKVVSWSKCQDEWNRKVTTTTGGKTIQVWGGSFKIGKTIADTIFFWLPTIQKTNPPQVNMPDAQFLIFLATFTNQ